MYLNDLPQPIRAFLEATQKRDSAALLSALTDDAVLVDMGKERRAGDLLTQLIIIPSKGSEERHDY